MCVCVCTCMYVYNVCVCTYIMYVVQLLFICRKTDYFKKNYFTNFAKYMMSLFLDIARESS